MDDRLRRAPVGVIETTTGGRITDANETAATTVGTSREALRGTDIRESFPKSAAGTLRAAFDGSPTERSFEEYYPRIERWLAVDIHVDDEVLVYVRDRTDHRETSEAVDRLERRLERVQRISTLVVTVLQRVIGASGRADVGRTVCERLGGTDLYRFAWVGDREFPEDRLRVLAASGDASTLRDRIDDSLDGDDGRLPGQAAVETGETRLVQAIAEDDGIPDGVRRAAFGNGLRSCLAIPLAYQGTVYGVVSVYSDREDGFSEQERVGLETLGSVAGFAIRAIRQEDLLVADTVTEVTVEVRDGTLPFVRAAREAGCELSLDGAVPRSDGTVVCYLSPTEPGTAVDEPLADDGTVADVRWIRSEQDPLLQVTVSSGTAVTALTGWGATVSDADYTGESARLVARAPPDGDVRRMVEALDATVAETTLVSKEERTRTAEPVEAFRDALGERLTDKQRTVLRTAYLSDYFESPRGSTSEEVAETLDIAGPTMLYHLRRAQRELVEALLETDPGVPTADGSRQ